MAKPAITEMGIAAIPTILNNDGDLRICFVITLFDVSDSSMYSCNCSIPPEVSANMVMDRKLHGRRRQLLSAPHTIFAFILCELTDMVCVLRCGKNDGDDDV